MQRAPFHSNPRMLNMLYSKVYKQFYVIALASFFACLPVAAMQEIKTQAAAFAESDARFLFIPVRTKVKNNKLLLKAYIRRLNRAAKKESSWEEQRRLIKKAVEQGFAPDVVRYRNVPSEKDVSALVHAVFENDKDFVQYLLKHGASAKIASQEGPILFCSIQNIDIFELLLEHGAHLNVVSEYGMTVLYCMARRKALDMRFFELCKSHNIDVSLYNTNGEGPFHVLLKREDDCSGTIQALIDLGVSLDPIGEVVFTTHKRVIRPATFIEALKINIMMLPAPERIGSDLIDVTDQAHQTLGKILEQMGKADWAERLGTSEGVAALLREEVVSKKAHLTKLLETVQQAALARKKLICDAIGDAISHGVQTLVLSYYEKEDFSQTDEEIKKMYESIKKA